MKAEELQKMFNRLEMPDWRDQDAFNQYLFLQTWVSIAVSLARLVELFEQERKNRLHCAICGIHLTRELDVRYCEYCDEVFCSDDLMKHRREKHS